MRTFFGWCLMAVGGLIALTCGLCTIGVIAIGVAGAFGRPGGGPVTIVLTVLTALVCGGLPTLVGAGVFVAGRTLARPSRKPPGGVE